MAGAMSGALPACCTNFSCVPTPRNCRAVRWRTQWPRNGWLGAPNARAKVGWDLILEYLFGACSVAVGWSGYVSLLLNDFGIHLPTALSQAPLDFAQDHLVTTGAILNVPAVLIIVIVTTVLVLGIHRSVVRHHLRATHSIEKLDTIHSARHRALEPLVIWKTKPMASLPRTRRAEPNR
jgi:hypothetical protein